MATLNNRSPKHSFQELLKLTSPDLNTTMLAVENGLGVATPLQLSTTQVAINGMVFPQSGASVGKVLAVSSDGTTMEWITVSGGTSLPSQTGQSGKYLTTNGSSTSWGTITVLAPSGSTNSIQTRSSSGTFQGTSMYVSGSTMTVNNTIKGTDTVVDGSGGDLNLVGGTAGYPSSQSGGDIRLTGGYANSGGWGGDVILTGGGSPSGSGGAVYLQGGPNGGTVYLRTTTTSTQVERLRVTKDGAWGLGGANYGTAGQILSSNGSSSAPTWKSTIPSLTVSGRATLTSYAEVTTSITATPAQTFDCSLSNIFAVTLSDSIISFLFSNVPTTGTSFSLTLFITQSGGGSKTIAWPGSVKWSKGIAPTLTTAAGKTDVITLVTFDGGTTWFGFPAGMDF